MIWLNWEKSTSGFREVNVNYSEQHGPARDLKKDDPLLV